MPVGTPAAGALARIRRAFERLNPCGDLDVDLLAVSRAAACSSTADWSAQALTNVVADAVTGLVTLAPTTATTIFSQTAGSGQAHAFHDAQDGVEEYALDFFPDPSAFNGVPFTLDSLDLFLALGSFIGKSQFLRVIVGAYDARWRLVPLGDPIDINTRDIIAAAPGTAFGGVYSIRFLADHNRRLVFEPGTLTTRTGAGRDSSGLIRTVAVDATGASTIVLARGLSVSVQPMGPGFAAASIGTCPSGTLAGFNPGAFWRYAPDRQMGPYDPDVAGYAASDVNHNPDDHLTTGAVPGYGAIAGTSGQWGIARRIPTAQRAQNASYGWHQPYHVLRAVAYQPSGSVVAALDLGGVPMRPVQIRLNDVQPAGTAIAYTLHGSNTGPSGPWTALGAVTDGQELTGASLYRYYQLTATFTAGGGATKFATPALVAWQMVERVTLSTWRYLAAFDADATVDPVTAQSSVAELQLPLVKAGVRSYRDLATLVNSQYAPASIEAHVYARDTISGTRVFLNSYRLENRDPQDGREEMTFTGGLDLLSGLIPPSVESYRYPASGQATITSVTGSAPNLTIGITGGTAWASENVSGMRYHGVTGASAKLDYTIQHVASPTSFVISTDVTGTGQYGASPAVGDTFEIHSDATSRGPLTYAGQDFAAIAADLLTVQSGVPSRYRGQLPATTGRTSGTYTLPSDGVKGLDILSTIALHCGGAWQWSQGRISYFDIYGAKDSVLTLDERHYTDLETPVGADRRMPSVKAKYGYQPDTQQFSHELQTDDADTLAGWGRANLFDVFDVPDDTCVWNDGSGTEAAYLTAMLQKAWKSGVRLWKVSTVFQYPWLEFGDAVTIVTDQYTDRRLAFSSDGVTDIGAPIAGRIAAVGVIVGKNLWGDKLVVAVRGLDAITSVASNAAGTVAGTTATPEIPTPSCGFDAAGQAIVSVVGDSATASIKYLVRTDRLPTAAEVRATTAEVGNNLANVASGVAVAAGGTAYLGALAYNAAGDESPLGTATPVRGASPTNPANPSPPIAEITPQDASDETAQAITFAALPGVNGGSSSFDYTITQRTGASSIVLLSGSATASALPQMLTIQRHPRFSRVLELAVTDHVTGLVAQVARYTLAAISAFQNNSGELLRDAPFSDGGYALAASNSAGTDMTPGAVDSAGRPINEMFHIPSNTIDNINDGSVHARATIAQLGYADRAGAAIDSSGRLQTSVLDSATIGGRSAGLVTRAQFSSVFTEDWSASNPQPTWSIVPEVGAAFWSIVPSAGSTRGPNILTATSYVALNLAQAIPFDPNKLYRFRVRVQQTGSALTYIGILQRDYQGNQTNANSGAGYILAGGDNFNGRGWVTLTTWVRGASVAYGTTSLGGGGTPAAPIALNSGTVSILPYLLLNYQDASGVNTVIDYFEITEYDEDGSARTYGALTGTANLQPGVQQANGASTRRPASGRQSFTSLQHGATLGAFDGGPYANPVSIRLFGAASYEPASVWSTSDPGSAGTFGALPPLATRQVPEVQIVNQTAATGTVRARLRQLGVPTNRSDAFGSTPVTTVGGESDVTSTHAPAADDTYVATFDYQIQASGGLNASMISMVVALDYWTGAAWSTLATQTITATDPGSRSGGTGLASASATGATIVGSVTGRTSTSAFRLTVQSVTSQGSGPSVSVTAKTLTYTTSGSDQYANAAPSGSGINLQADLIGAS